MSSIEIYFQAHHESELWSQDQLLTDGVRIFKVWDSYVDNLPMEEARITEEAAERFYQSRVLLMSNRRVIPESYRSTVLVDAPPFDPETDVYLLYISNIGQFKEHLLGPWAMHLLAAEEKRGADDGTYDYYPDLWFVSRQLFTALGLQAEYNKLRQQLFNTTDYGDPEGDLMELIEEAE